LVAIGAWLITHATEFWVGAAGTLLGSGLLLAMALLATGAVELYIRQTPQAGLVGTAGLTITCLGLGMAFVGVAGMGLPGTFAPGLVWPCFALGVAAVLPSGMLLDAAAMVRAKIVPIWLALSFCASALAVLGLAWFGSGVPSNMRVLVILSLLGAVWTVAGCVLWRDSRRAIAQPTPATV
jgi:hypothetical protein